LAVEGNSGSVDFAAARDIRPSAGEGGLVAAFDCEGAHRRGGHGARQPWIDAYPSDGVAVSQQFDVCAGTILAGA
jgi:hypothetical protein